MLDRICSASYAPPPEGACSEGVRELLSKLLQLDPSVRPSAQDVLNHPALRPVLQQLEPPAPPPPQLRQHLSSDSSEVEAMRRAVRDAAAKEAEAAAHAEHRPDHTGGG